MASGRRQGRVGSRPPVGLDEVYLSRLKDLLEEVIEQKSAIESLVRESWAYLKHDRNSLLQFDVVDLEATWQQLQNKLRRLAVRPWTSQTHLFEHNHYFASRIKRHDRRERRQQQKYQQHELSQSSLSISQTSIPCFYNSLDTKSSSEEFKPHISAVSYDFDLSSIDIDSAPEPNNSQKRSTADTSFVRIANKEHDNFDIVSINDLVSTENPHNTFCKASREESSLPDLLSSDLSDFSEQLENCQHRPEIGFYSNNSLDRECNELSDSSDLESFYSRDNDRCGYFSNGSSLPYHSFNICRMAMSDGNLLTSKSLFPLSLNNVAMDVPAVANHTRNGRSPPSSGRTSPLGVRPATHLGIDDSPVLQKKRRMNSDLPIGRTEGMSSVSSMSSASSPCDSPTSLHLMLNPGMPLPFNVNSSGISFDETFDELSDSQLSGPETPTSRNPGGGGKERKKTRYRKDELWAAIQSDYHYLMDGEIIETCRSTESDLSWESDDLLSQTKVSFTEFMQQYKDLTEWLNHIQLLTQRQSASLSEKYLNQTYHEEMLQRSPRRKVFNDYAKQLMRRYPSMRDEIQIPLQHLNGQWDTLEKVISAGGATRDEQTMLRDLEQDLNGLRKWLHDVECRLQPLCVRPHWDRAELEMRLKEHQVLQFDIESHSKIVSAVLKLCDHLQTDKDACSNEVEKDSLQLIAINLERRWHAIWLQSLEWQCRLEEAITKGNVLHSKRGIDKDWGGRFSFSQTTTVNITNHDLSDAQSSCDEELSELIDSDSFSNSDIIPFASSEYEKICEDTDCQTEKEEEEDRQLSPGGASESSKGSGCSSGMDPAIDSALGRSVSDHSINNDIHQHQLACQSAQRITSDQVNRAVNKVVSFAQEADMHGCSDMMTRSGETDKVKRMKSKGDHDIGYSSESHSNDEPDFGCLPLGEDQEVPNESTDNQPREGSPESSIERPRSLGTIIFRRSNRTGSEEDDMQGDSGTGPSPLTPDKSWRHSMTSAYDTGSQCSASRSNSPFDINSTLETTLDTSVCTTVDHAEVELENDTYSSLQDLMSSSSQSFYVMTSVESDPETTSNKAVAEVNVTTGEDIDREGSDREANELPKHRYLLEQSTPLKSFQHDSHSRDSPTLADCSCTPIKGNDLLSGERRTESIIAQVDSEGNTRDSLSGDEHCDSIHSNIHKLVQQAELMVRDNDISSSPISKLRRRRKARRVRPAGLPLDSYTDTTNATSDCPTDSCDASAESTDSESETCLTSDSEGMHGKLVKGVDVGIIHNQKCHTLPRAKCDQRKGQQQRHTCSVTQLYELSNRLDLAPFSISEGAIDCAYTSRKVRRLSAIPYRKRKLLPRSASYECGQTAVSSSSLGMQRGCSSMPSSRQQSSQEWMAQQSLSSPDRSPSTEAWLQDWPAAHSEGLSDTDMAEIPKPQRVRQDSDTEATWGRSVFNTTGEFSENAWDPYQDPLYHVTSDDPTEERLDPLGFDCDLEYDHHFHLDNSFGIGDPLSQSTTIRPREIRTSVSAIFRDIPPLEDSDSDLEDLQHVLEESRKQICVAETVLANTHKDGHGTGLYLDPSPYTELVATCQTNIKCLEVLCDTIDSGEVANSTFTEDDIQVVFDIVDRWGQVHALAVRRQAQSRELAGLTRELVALRTALTDASDDMDLLCGFDDVAELESAVQDLQARAMELSLRRPAVEAVTGAVRAFTAIHMDVNMTGFTNEVHALATDLHIVTDRCNHQVSMLKSALLAWYDFRETAKELAYLTGRDQHQLNVLAVTYDVIAVCLPDALDTVHDLKLMKAEFELYKRKLSSLCTLSAEIMPICDETGASVIHRVVADMTAEVDSIATACKELMDVLEDKITKQGGHVLLYPDTRVPQTRLKRAINGTLNMLKPVPTNAEPPSLMWRILRVAVPLHLTLIMLLGLAYLLDPDTFGICISPQLRYVRGPPPV